MRTRTLNTVHERLMYFSGNLQLFHQYIFGYFIDLKKVFDSVWRLGLLYKILQNQNIGSRLYNIIKDMHKHTEASVKMGENLSNFVNVERGG